MLAKQNFIAKLTLILLIVGMGGLPIASTMHAGTHLSPASEIAHSSDPILASPHSESHAAGSQHCGLCILLHRSLFALALCAAIFVSTSSLFSVSIHTTQGVVKRYLSPSPPRAPPVFA